MISGISPPGNNLSRMTKKKADIPFSAGSSFQEHLESQLGLRELTDKQKILVNI